MNKKTFEISYQPFVEDSFKREERELAGVFEKKFATYNGALHIEDGQLLNQYNEEIQLKRFSWNSSLKIF